MYVMRWVHAVQVQLFLSCICSLDLRRGMLRSASDGPEEAYQVVVNYLSDKWDISHRRPIAITVGRTGVGGSG